MAATVPIKNEPVEGETTLVQAGPDRGIQGMAAFEAVTPAKSSIKSPAVYSYSIKRSTTTESPIFSKLSIYDRRLDVICQRKVTQFALDEPDDDKDDDKDDDEQHEVLEPDENDDCGDLVFVGQEIEYTFKFQYEMQDVELGRIISFPQIPRFIEDPPPPDQVLLEIPPVPIILRGVVLIDKKGKETTETLQMKVDDQLEIQLHRLIKNNELFAPLGFYQRSPSALKQTQSNNLSAYHGEVKVRDKPQFYRQDVQVLAPRDGKGVRGLSFGTDLRLKPRTFAEMVKLLDAQKIALMEIPPQALQAPFMLFKDAVFHMVLTCTSFCSYEMYYEMAKDICRSGSWAGVKRASIHLPLRWADKLGFMEVVPLMLFFNEKKVMFEESERVIDFDEEKPSERSSMVFDQFGHFMELVRREERLFPLFEPIMDSALSLVRLEGCLSEDQHVQLSLEFNNLLTLAQEKTNEQVDPLAAMTSVISEAEAKSETDVMLSEARVATDRPAMSVAVVPEAVREMIERPAATEVVEVHTVGGNEVRWHMVIPTDIFRDGRRVHRRIHEHLSKPFIPEHGNLKLVFVLEEDRLIGKVEIRGVFNVNSMVSLDLLGLRVASNTKKSLLPGVEEQTVEWTPRFGSIFEVSFYNVFAVSKVAVFAVRK